MPNNKKKAAKGCRDIRDLFAPLVPSNRNSIFPPSSNRPRVQQPLAQRGNKNNNTDCSRNTGTNTGTNAGANASGGVSKSGHAKTCNSGNAAGKENGPVQVHHTGRSDSSSNNNNQNNNGNYKQSRGGASATPSVRTVANASAGVTKSSHAAAAADDDLEIDSDNSSNNNNNNTLSSSASKNNNDNKDEDEGSGNNYYSALSRLASENNNDDATDHATDDPTTTTPVKSSTVQWKGATYSFGEPPLVSSVEECLASYKRKSGIDKLLNQVQDFSTYVMLRSLDEILQSFLERKFIAMQNETDPALTWKIARLKSGTSDTAGVYGVAYTKKKKPTVVSAMKTKIGMSLVGCHDQAMKQNAPVAALVMDLERCLAAVPPKTIQRIVDLGLPGLFVHNDRRLSVVHLIALQLCETLHACGRHLYWNRP